MLLNKNVALITGAGRGWGRSIAIAFARNGATVVAVSRTQSEINETVRMVRAEGGSIEGHALDVSDSAAMEGFVSSIVEKYGCIDILVNNAAILPNIAFEALTMDEIQRIFAINLMAPIRLCKKIVPVMRENGGGSIINVSSGSGVRGFANESIYCASKHGLEGLTKSLAMELASENIAVNTITPGGSSCNVRIKPTNLTDEVFAQLPDAERAKWTDSIVSTDAFVFLARQRGSGVTGKRILAYEFSQRLHAEGWGVTIGDLREGVAEEGMW